MKLKQYLNGKKFMTLTGANNVPGIMNDFVKIKTIFKKAFMNENN